MHGVNFNLPGSFVPSVAEQLFEAYMQGIHRIQNSLNEVSSPMTPASNVISHNTRLAHSSSKAKVR